MDKITFVGFLDQRKLKYNKTIFDSDEMYRAKIIKQHLQKYRIYCNRNPGAKNDLKFYENVVWEYEQKISSLKW